MRDWHLLFERVIKKLISLKEGKKNPHFPYTYFNSEEPLSTAKLQYLHVRTHSLHNQLPY